MTVSELLEFLIRECGYTLQSAFETVGSLGTGDASYAFATDTAGTMFYIGYAGTAESPDQFTVTDNWR